MKKTTNKKYQLLCHHTGEVLYEGYFKTLRHCVETAIGEKICLDGVDLSGANLICANLDDAQMAGAKLSGANLTGANVSEAILDYADMTCVDLSQTCFAMSSLMNVNFYGASFSSTDVTDAVLSGCQFSCPSMFTVMWHRAALFSNCHYAHSHHNHQEHYDLFKPPISVQGLARDFIVLDDAVKIGAEIISKQDIICAGRSRLTFLYGEETANFLMSIFYELGVMA